MSRARNHQNPHYAPESLERKLNPSGIVAVPVAAEVFIPHTQIKSLLPVATLAGVVAAAEGPVPSSPGDPAPIDTNPPTDPAPPNGDGTPPLGGPDIPVGPGEPG